ncbi:hypothetical protein RhiirC2_768075 [Rhizophagus irregularis]|uniref:Uncharacterized protein n=1 Tax=Rhizophagus irregularis TaxID=588596 RepID=A0A2N1P2P5_9GLOM|nr:hypothetical protein RhiirC2_768075 [Rhizophagus irregularis]
MNLLPECLQALSYPGGMLAREKISVKEVVDMVNKFRKVVEIVKEYRRNDNMEFEYTRYDLLAIKDHTDKIDNKTQGLEIIFENNIKEEVLAEWVRNNDKKFEISEEIIRLAEQIENKEEEATNENDKRLKSSPPAEKYQKRWRVEGGEEMTDN